ncbi:MAG: mercuric reductase [Bradyrhizobium sp.]|nr:mercuric reductase [Bradyrhizobium sp.]
MSDIASRTLAAERPAVGSGAALFTLAGLAAAFGLAACCALPLLLTTIGLSTAWLGGVALMAAPHRETLQAVGALCLLGGAVLLWRQQRAAATCGANGVCIPPAVRVLTLVGLLIGAGLLWAGYTYV